MVGCRETEKSNTSKPIIKKTKIIPCWLKVLYTVFMFLRNLFSKKGFLNYIAITIIIIAGLLLVADLFFIPGRAITFDGHIHMATIAQFAAAIKELEIPVRWSNNFANYGLPLPIFAHQIPAYLGAFFEILVNNPVMSFNLTMLIGVIGSSVAFYLLLREYVDTAYALIGALIFNFAPYRIINIYIRGALPELFASMFLPIILIGIVKWFRDKKPYAIVICVLGITGLALTHPMLLFPSSLVFLPFVIYYNWPLNKNWLNLLKFGGVCLIAAGLASYYLLPLLLESKYFYIGQTQNLFVSHSFLNISNYFQEKWFYFLGHPGPRGDHIIFGLIESIILVIGFVIALLNFIKTRQVKLVQLLVFISLLLFFSTLPVSKALYENIFLLDNLQFSWRMIGLLLFIPPFLLVILFQKFIKNKKLGIVFGILALVVVLFYRVPQLYQKNSTVYDVSNYYFVHTNLHTKNLNTIWSDDSENYPVKTKQFEIVEGEGEVEPILLKNSKRHYQVKTNQELKMVDYTFYFPGWKVFANGEEILIEFQDPEHRGLITYQLPAGKYLVEVIYTNTKVRSLGYLLSVFSGGVLLGLVCLIRKKIKQKS